MQRSEKPEKNHNQRYRIEKSWWKCIEKYFTQSSDESTEEEKSSISETVQRKRTEEDGCSEIRTGEDCCSKIRKEDTCE